MTLIAQTALGRLAQLPQLDLLARVFDHLICSGAARGLSDAGDSKTVLQLD